MISTLPDELADDVKAALGEAWEALTSEHRAQLERLIKDVATFAQQAITEPDQRVRHQRNLQHALSAISSRAQIAQMDAAEEVRTALRRIIERAIPAVIGAVL